MPDATARQYGAAHIVTTRAQLGDPEIVIMTREDADSGPPEPIASYPLPAGFDYLPAAVTSVYNLTGWHPVGAVTDVSPGYAVVNVERAAPVEPDIETAHVIVGPHGELATTVIHVDVPEGFEPDIDGVYVWDRHAYRPWASIRHDEQGLIIWAVRV